MKLVVSCEHGGNRVPAPYAWLFAGCEQALASHRGWDPGALWLARRLARAFDAPLHATTVTRLLVDTNRSEHHPRLFSSWCAPLSREERNVVLDRHYRAHRSALERRLRKLANAGDSVLHLAVHSFTPRWQGQVRRCDIGLLYDPQRKAERAPVSALAKAPAARVRPSCACGATFPTGVRPTDSPPPCGASCRRAPTWAWNSS